MITYEVQLQALFYVRIEHCNPRINHPESSSLENIMIYSVIWSWHYMFYRLITNLMVNYTLHKNYIYSTPMTVERCGRDFTNSKFDHYNDLINVLVNYTLYKNYINFTPGRAVWFTNWNSITTNDATNFIIQKGTRQQLLSSAIHPSIIIIDYLSLPSSLFVVLMPWWSIICNPAPRFFVKRHDDTDTFILCFLYDLVDPTKIVIHRLSFLHGDHDHVGSSFRAFSSLSPWFDARDGK